MGGNTRDYPNEYDIPKEVPRPPPQPQQIYKELRQQCADLERWLESNQGCISEKEFKRLDKAVVVMKAGFKIMKKAIHNHKTNAKLKLVG